MTTPRTPVVFIHGLWLHATSWGPWLDLFADAGYQPIAPGWPNEPASVQEAREQPDAVANIGIDDATGHFATVIEGLTARPVIIGHSFGGLIAEKLLGQGYGVAGVAIDPAQIKGVLPLPLAQLRAGLPGLGNPANLHKAVSLTRRSSASGSATRSPNRSRTRCTKSGPSPRRLGRCSRPRPPTSSCTRKRRSTPATTPAGHYCSSPAPPTTLSPTSSPVRR